jgi:hypothetical protein
MKCDILMEGKVAELIDEAHDSQVERFAQRVHDITKSTFTFTHAAHAATLAADL